MLTTHEPGRTVVSGYLYDDAAGPALTRDAVVVDNVNYTARVEPSRVGAFPATTITSPGATTVRPMFAGDPDEPAARLGRADTYLVGVLLSGAGKLWSTRTLDLAPGTITLYPSDDPFVLEFYGAHRYFVTEMPATAFGRRERGLGNAVANGELAQTPLARMAADMLSTMPRVADRAPWALRHRLGETVVALLRSAIDELDGVPSEREPADLVDAVFGWIDEHLGEADLTPGRIAAAHHISVRYLHKLFEPCGMSVSEAVRRRRVERIKEDLCSPALAGWSVAAIGARWGVEDATQLIRQFKTIENMTPGEWRRTAGRFGPGELT